MSELVVLEIDAGNSSIKWRVVQSASTMTRGVVLWSDLPTTAAFNGLMSFGFGKIVLASVAGEDKTNSLLAALSDCFPCVDVERVYSAREMGGVRFAYADSSTLGVDRCLAMVASYAEFKSGALVLDCGSAMTADFVDASGWHLGGYIFPGLRLLKQGLQVGTACVPTDQAQGLELLPGSSTKSCVDRAISLMVRSTLLSLLEYSNSVGINCVVITGGDADWVAGLVDVEFHYRQDLVLDGLSLMGVSEKVL